MLLHIGGDEEFTTSKAWGEGATPEADPDRDQRGPADPFTLSTAHLAAQNFLSAMILGGVFERHPKLRFGVIELGGH